MPVIDDPDRPLTRYLAVADPLRWQLLRHLAEEGPLPTFALLALAPTLSRQGVAKHLAVLEKAGLVESIRDGRDRFWRVRARALADAGDRLARLALRADARLAELRARVGVAPG